MHERSAGRSFLKPFFSYSRTKFSSSFFTWYYWLRKFPIVFQPIIIENDNVYFSLVLHLKCSALSQSESSNFFMYIIINIIKCPRNYTCLNWSAQAWVVLHLIHVLSSHNAQDLPVCHKFECMWLLEHFWVIISTCAFFRECTWET